MNLDDIARTVQVALTVATAEKVDDHVANARARHCRVCPHLTFAAVRGIGTTLAVCGSLNRPNETTCGCIVGTVATNEPHPRPAFVPAAKVRIRGQACPQGLWAAEQD